LRGDVGVGALQMNSWRSTLQPFDETGQSLANSGDYIVPAFASIGDTTFAGVGFGYQFNHWFRADITGEYRTEATYRAGLAGVNTYSGWTGFDTYNGGVSTALFMAKAISISAHGIASRRSSAAASASPPINSRG
jgi:hypothetical protein